MGTTKINDITQALAAQMANLTAGIEGSDQKVSGVESFSKSLDEATSKIAKIDDKSGDIANRSNGTTIDKSSSRDIKTNNKAVKDNSSDTDVREKVSKDIAKTADKVEKSIKDAMDVSEEEIEGAMESLGMSMQDLLDPKKLQELMMELGGVSDSISLITNEKLYGDIKSIVGLAIGETESIISTNGISAEEFTSVINDSELMDNAFLNFEDVLNQIGEDADDAAELLASVEGIEQSNGDLPEGQALSQKEPTATSNESDEKTSNAVEVTITGDAKPVNSADEAVTKVDSKTSNINEAVQNGTKDLSETESFTSVAKSETDPMKGRNEGFENVSKMSKIDRSLTDGISDASSFTENMTVKTEVNNVGDIVETVTTYSSNDANEIVSQVTESIRVNYAEDTTSLELQLHPASLGTVNMTVSATNGIVTAHIIVQDEAVKAALESQLLTLQETFEEQGHKVEAVEVSIANYDLNQGMNRDNSQNENEKNEKDAIRTSGTRRRINLSDLEDEGEEEQGLSEDERIARDIMARNGNTLDYQA